LWLVTSYFNPVGYQSKAHNYEIFRDVIARSQLNLLTVECAFGDDPFTLTPASDVMQVRGQDIMWQKERLLNLAIGRLPRRCAKVAWLDCDIVFENPGWAVATSRLLDRYPLVQPFATAIRLPRGCQEYRGEGDVWRGFGEVYAAHPQYMRGANYRRHGEAGLAWAARRDVVAASGLYDAGITGGGDHAIVHASCGDCASPCLDGLLGVHSARRQHFMRWGEAFYKHVRGEIGYVAGAVLHLWHGERADRRYAERHKALESSAFDPEKDLQVGAAGCWEWASDKPAMHRWVAAYFAQRNEDGTAEVEACNPVELPAR
jgi:hypothetical protein